MSRSSRYTDIELVESIRRSYSIRQVLIHLGLAPQGGNYSTVHRAISRLNLDTSHFTGQSSNRGKTFGFKRPIEEYLQNKYPIQSFKLRNRLLKENIFKHQCSQCKGRSWRGKEIPLELDHINGDSEDNRLKNLRLLCPNCHAQTPTYRGRNRKSF